ncbi:MAG: class I SAM-dependent methyltransferase, partial [Acidimicrobiales bacterium]
AAGWTAVALEQDADGAGVARSRGLPAVQADAGVIPLATASLDLVVAMDVLEHLDDDTGALAEWTRVLAPGGTLLVTVPADPDLWSDHDVVVGHRRRYLAVELRALVERAGLDLVTLWPWNVLLRPAMVLHRRNRAGSDLDFVPTPLNLALRAVIEAERFVPWVQRGRGVTLVLRATRPAAAARPLSGAKYR